MINEQLLAAVREACDRQGYALKARTYLEKHHDRRVTVADLQAIGVSPELLKHHEWFRVDLAGVSLTPKAKQDVGDVG